MPSVKPHSSENICEPKAVASARFLAFEGHRCIAAGDLAEVARKVKPVIDDSGRGSVLILDAISSQPVEVDFRGSIEEVTERLVETVITTPERRGPGRPKLGVVGREVTLLPRHWDWLDKQPGGASVALRKLVEEARRTNRGKDVARESQDAVYRFMTEMAGDLPGFEEALRAFYRGNKEALAKLTQPWPLDIRNHLQTLVNKAFRDAAEAEKC